MFKDDIYSLGQILEILLSGRCLYLSTIAVIVANYFKSESLSQENQKSLTEREEILKKFQVVFSC